MRIAQTLPVLLASNALAFQPFVGYGRTTPFLTRGLSTRLESAVDPDASLPSKKGKKAKKKAPNVAVTEAAPAEANESNKAAEKKAAEEAQIMAEKWAAEEAEKKAVEASKIAAEKKAAEEEVARIAAEKKATKEAQIAAEKKAAGEEAARIAAEKKAAEGEAARVMEMKREVEAKQRGILSDKLGRDAKVYAEHKAKEETIAARGAAIADARRPHKSKDEEAALQNKYAQMDVKDRAYAILVDLGLVESSS
jgi:hypothetical protein